MRRNLLLAMALMAFMTAPSMAAMTVEESTDAEYLINAGYSQAVAEDVFVLKSRAAGKPIEPLYEKSQNAFVRGWKKFYSYLDPAQENDDKLHHDIKGSPSYTDL